MCAKKLYLRDEDFSLSKKRSERGICESAIEQKIDRILLRTFKNRISRVQKREVEVMSVPLLPQPCFFATLMA